MGPLLLFACAESTEFRGFRVFVGAISARYVFGPLLPFASRVNKRACCFHVGVALWVQGESLFMGRVVDVWPCLVMVLYCQEPRAFVVVAIAIRIWDSLILCPDG